MTGWRIGFAVGNKEVLGGLGRVKSQLDSGVFEAVQAAGITALGLDDSVTDGLRKIYQERRDTLVPGLKKLGLEVDPPPRPSISGSRCRRDIPLRPSPRICWKRPALSRRRETASARLAKGMSA